MRRVLVTAFEPFGGESINPSEEVLKVITSSRVDLIKCYLPTTYQDIEELIRKEIAEKKPDDVIMLGQAGGRKGISLERFAINIDDAALADNRGEIRDGLQIIADGMDAYRSNLPLHALKMRLINAGIPAHVSNHAGSFVCNHLSYIVLHEIFTKDLKMRAGFIHIPYLHAQVLTKDSVFSMSLDEMAKAIEIILDGLD